MKQALTILLVFLAVTGNAQTKIERAIEALRLAMISGNRDSLQNLVSDKLSYGHSSGAVDDKKTFVEKIASGKSDFVTIELKEQTITVSGRTAIVRHLLHAQTNDGGKPGEVHLRVLLVWQKQRGKWKLLARQAVKTG